VNAATLLTISRLFLAPVFVFVLLQGTSGTTVTVSAIGIGLILMILSELSDAFDGFVARKTGTVTDLGKVLDPLCDSASRLTVFLGFVLVGMMPWWMLIAFLYRDALLSLLRICAAKTGLVLSARKSGKLKAIFQSVAIFLSLIVLYILNIYPDSMPQFIWNMHLVGWVFLFPALFAIISAVDYLAAHGTVLKKMSTTN